MKGCLGVDALAKALLVCHRAHEGMRNEQSALSTKLHGNGGTSLQILSGSPSTASASLNRIGTSITAKGSLDWHVKSYVNQEKSSICATFDRSEVAKCPLKGATAEGLPGLR